MKGIGLEAARAIEEPDHRGRPLPRRESAVCHGGEGGGGPVPTYRVGRPGMELTCYRCKNKFKVSGELKTGWCPYCGTRLAVR